MISIIQVRDDSGLSPGGRGGFSDLVLDSGYIFKVQPSQLVEDIRDVECEEKKSIG